ncbi:MAG: hypothetical protein MMC33_000503 [Icmadophila ericetorum]|nr:hypothetical protein [Icmadophila ericetorum]
MFSQNMNFSNVSQMKSDPTPAMIMENPMIVEQHQVEAPKTYSISQHYHHSGHVAPKSVSVPELHSHGLSIAIRNLTTELLTSNWIDPACLLPTQISLFENATPEQKARLIEIWRLSPPEYTMYGMGELQDELGDWRHTTVQQEEEMARIRLQRKEIMSQQTESDKSMSVGSGTEHSEPYITSGYEMLAQREYEQQKKQAETKEQYSDLGPPEANYVPSTDPVFKSTEWWRHDYAGLHQPIEHQYGMFDQMNQFRAPAHVSVGHGAQEDEEML